MCVAGSGAVRRKPYLALVEVDQAPCAYQAHLDQFDLEKSAGVIVQRAANAEQHNRILLSRCRAAVQSLIRPIVIRRKDLAPFTRLDVARPRLHF